jgi:hypothetical protein
MLKVSKKFKLGNFIFTNNLFDQFMDKLIIILMFISDDKVIGLPIFEDIYEVKLFTRFTIHHK